MRRPLGSIVPILGMCAVVPVGLILAFGEIQIHPAPWVHFYGVGGSALAAALPQIGSPRSIRIIIALEAVIATAIVAFCAIGMTNPTLVPGVPNAKSPA